MNSTMPMKNIARTYLPAMRYLIALAILFPLFCSAEIYKWTDDQGRVHYGDSPKKEDHAKKINATINSYTSVTYSKIEPKYSSGPKIVTMYGTSWCRYCKEARKYFQQNGIAYTEYDIEKDMRAKSRYDQIGGKGVPVILVGEKRMNGFSTQGFERIYK